MASGYLLLIGTYPNLILASFVFWSTLLIYTINTRIKFNFLNPGSYSALSIKALLKEKLALIAAIMVLSHIPFLKFSVILFLSHLGLISTLYNVPDRSRGKLHLPLRSVPFLKIFLIAYVWSAMATWLPAIQEDIQLFTTPQLRVFSGHLLFVFAITIPFDIRDMARDVSASLITIPNVIGIRRAKVLSIISLLLFGLVMYPLISLEYLLILIMAIGVLVFFATAKRKEYYYTLFMDGTIVLYLCSIILTLKN